MKILAASTKTVDENSAGGFGEGAKMASKTMLHKGMVDKITFASGDWTMDFTREPGYETNKRAHMQRTLTENSERVDGTYVEFETADVKLVEAMVRAKDYFKHSENPDYQNFDYENEFFGIRILDPNDRGNLYYNQRYAMKDDGNLDGALKGMRLVIKKGVDPKDSRFKELSNDCDRTGFTSSEISSIGHYVGATITDKTQMMNLISQLENFWIENNINVFYDNSAPTRPEVAFARALLHQAASKKLRINSEDLKIVAFDGLPKEKLYYLVKKGYRVAYREANYLGIKNASEVYRDLTKVTPKTRTSVEVQKLDLLMDVLPQIDYWNRETYDLDKRPIRLEVFEKQGDQANVHFTDDYVAIDRNYLKNVDFNTLYTEILTQSLKAAGDAADWGYAITDMISYQTELLVNPKYKEIYDATKREFESLIGKE